MKERASNKYYDKEGEYERQRERTEQERKRESCCWGDIHDQTQTQQCANNNSTIPSQFSGWGHFTETLCLYLPLSPPERSYVVLDVKQPGGRGRQIGPCWMRRGADCASLSERERERGARGGIGPPVYLLHPRFISTQWVREKGD